MRLVMAASVTRPVCCSCSGSGHHLECPPAVLQCAAAQQQQRDLAPTNSKQQRRGRVCCQVRGILPSPTELTPHTLNGTFLRAFSFSFLVGLPGRVFAGNRNYESASSSAWLMSHIMLALFICKFAPSHHKQEEKRRERARWMDSANGTLGFTLNS